MATAVPVDPNEKNFVLPPGASTGDLAVSTVPGSTNQYVIGGTPTQLIPPPTIPATPGAPAPAGYTYVPGQGGYVRTDLTASGLPQAAAPGQVPAGAPTPLLAPPTPGTGAGTKANAPPQPSAPPQPPSSDVWGQIRATINKGESRGVDAATELWGGGHFTADTPSKPGYYGFPAWLGLPGPKGPSHAAGEAQWEPDTWKQAADAYVAAGNPAPNFRNVEDQRKVENFWAGTLYKQRTGRDLAADYAAGKADWNVLVDQWPSLAGGGAGANSPYAWAQKVQGDNYAAANNLNAAASQIIDSLKGDRGDIAKMAADIHAARLKSDEAQDAALAAIKQAPKDPTMDGVKHLSGLATIIGVLGGLFTRQPMLASLGAGAAAIEAYNANDLRAYNIAYKNWQNQTNLLFKIADMQSQRVRDIAEDDNMPIQAKRALLDTTLRAMGMEQLADAARTRGDTVVFNYLSDQAKLQEQARERQYQIDSTNQWRKDQLENKNWIPVTIDGKSYRMNTASGKVEPIIVPETGQQASDVTKIGTPRSTASGSGKADVDRMVNADVADFKAHNPTASPADVAAAQFTARIKREGEYASATHVARSGIGEYIQTFKANHPDADENAVNEAVAEFTRLQTVERAYANGPTKRNVDSLNTAAGHIALLREYAKAVKESGTQTDTPRVNMLLQALRSATGHAEITNFDTARDITTDEVVRLLTSTGGTEADRAGMASRIRADMSGQQLDGALTVLDRFIAERFEALEQGFAGNDPERRTYFENEKLTPTARAVFQQYPPLTPSPGGAAAPPPGGDTPPPGSPAGTKKAGDGHWYAPPEQPGGQYRRVDP
jgi:hypothetical protein